ncbi:pirin family protein [Paenibacillus sp. NEAU-GSW1]|uniref:pirin family protein n=1 Tax=Paenibacillus sp. NEAU-GSW1 TaxID=2682486 RepID=UPI0012E2414B|nr:pirin family protein [Paenibacillus sp. NEAU-GSW1]MUT66570.1 pirin family protein [Paenibacillus sp. NEAU-GSW1]
MIKHFPAHERNSVDMGWLRSARSFSFGDYFDQDNYGFGIMRVLNDDVVAPGKGFGAHPHSDMEIVTIPLAGRLKHEDNLGNAAVTAAGQVQRMTAGTGIIHAEYNDSDTEEVSFLQLWFMPGEKGLAPSYETASYDPDKLTNALVPIVTPDGAGETASIHQDMKIYLTRLEPGKKLYHHQPAGRRAFAMVLEGSVKLNHTQMGPKDSVRAEFEPEFLFRTESESAFVLFIDLP